MLYLENPTDKNTTHSYLPIYEQLLKAKKFTAKNIIDIGTYNGKNESGVNLWAQYFPNATIYALNTLSLDEEEDKIIFYANGAYEDEFFTKNFLDKIKCDIIIDDGTHNLEDIKKVIALYSQILTDDGILIIEDVQNIHWINELKEVVPDNLKKFVNAYDLRFNKKRNDDILFTIDKRNQKIPQTGFIMLRHVNSNLTNIYWNYCYDCIRKFYPEIMIIIIDDNSNYAYINSRNLYNTVVINSEYNGRGELLPYIYFIENKFFENAVIIHDSVFVNTYIDISVDKYKFLWEFEHTYDDIHLESHLIKKFNSPALMKFYENKHLWKGCFGGMTIINHDFLILVNKIYDMSKLIDPITSRPMRSGFERVLACLLQISAPKTTLYGNIHNYCGWGTKFRDRHVSSHLPLIKVWTGR